MKRFIILVVAIVFMSACMMMGTAETASADKPITLTFSCHFGDKTWGSVHGLNPWLDKLEKATGGKVKLDRYYSQTLVKLPDTLEALKNGIVDIAIIGPGFWPGSMPLNEVSALPFLGAKSSEQSAAVSWQLYEKIPEIKAEYTKYNNLPLVFMNVDYHTMTTEKAGPIRTIQDFKGKKLRTIAGPPHEAMLALGATPLYIPAPDLYMSLEKGVLDGANFPWETVGKGWNLYEVTAYQTDVNVFYGVYSISINLDTWKRLSPDIQKAMMSVSGYEGTRWYARNYFDSAKEPACKLYEKLAAQGKTREVISVPDSEVSKWAEVAGRPIWDKWVKDMEDKGYPMAQSVLAETLQLLKDYK